MQPITGPIYRYDEANAQPGAFPRYYDGSWLINNRGSNDGFWKEVQLRKDNNQMLRVNDWLPYNSRRHPTQSQLGPRHRHAVRPRRLALHVALLGRLLPLEHQRGRPEPDRQDLVQRPGRVPDRRGRAERDRRGHRPGLPGPGRTRTSTRPS